MRRLMIIISLVFWRKSAQAVGSLMNTRMFFALRLPACPYLRDDGPFIKTNIERVYHQP